MPKIAYIPMKRFSDDTLAIIAKADQIATDYQRRGFNLSLRQLYYQFVSVDFFPNTEASYNRLGRIVNDARMVGLIDWSQLEDRGREAYGVSWSGHVPARKSELVRGAKRGFSLDLWEGQERRVEVWVEKQALEEVASRAANQFRSGYFACKGYVSQSEMWSAGERLRDVYATGQDPLILHLGDHDPSGIDMTRDIQARLSTFAGFDVDVRRIALNRDQIDAYNPPPNPAKMTDSRFADYQAIHGDESWELDSLRPEMLVDLITSEINNELDVDLFNEKLDEEREGRKVFDVVADRWADVLEFLGEE